jgi:archaeosine synthase beta-subunit
MAYDREIRGRISKLMRGLRARAAPQQFDHNRIACHDVRVGHLDGKQVERFIVHFRSNGCLWCKANGGCTMCGFWNETARGREIVTVEAFVNQFQNVLNRFDLQRYPVLGLYNAGSFLQEQEIPFTAVERIFHLASRHLPDLRRVVIESRVEYITMEKLERLQNILGNNTELAIGMGFDSENEIVRNLIINKGVSKEGFERAIEITRQLDVQSIVYVLLKPPFLTEREAIEDAVESTRYVSGVGPTEIHYETVTVEADTLVDQLYTSGLYRPMWLWSIIEILKRVRSFAMPYMTPLRYVAQAVDVPRNCPACTEMVTDRIYNRYCSDWDLAHFAGLDCPCRAEWLEAVREEPLLSLEERVWEIVSDRLGLWKVS